MRKNLNISSLPRWAFFLPLFFISQILWAQAPVLQWAEQVGTVRSDGPLVSCFDKEGNIYVAGSITCPFKIGATQSDCETSDSEWHYRGFIGKFSSRGKLLNYATIPEATEDFIGWGGLFSPEAIEIDEAGNIYVGGSFERNFIWDGDSLLSEPSPSLPGYYTEDGILLKLDSELKKQWIKSYPSENDISFTEIEYSGDGAIYFGLNGDFSESLYCELIKMDTSGSALVRKDLSEDRMGVTIKGLDYDPNSNQLFVSGEISTGRNTYFINPSSPVDSGRYWFLTAIDDYINPNWLSLGTYSGACYLNRVAGNSEAVFCGGSAYGSFEWGNVSFNGSTSNSTGYIIKFDSNGTAENLVTIEGPGDESINGLALDVENSLYWSGMYQHGSSVYYPDGSTHKLHDSTGAFINAIGAIDISPYQGRWVKEIHTSYFVTLPRIDVFEPGIIICSGVFSGNIFADGVQRNTYGKYPGSFDGVIIKLDSFSLPPAPPSEPSIDTVPKLVIFPNPGNGLYSFYPPANTEGLIKVSIYDQMGRLVEVHGAYQQPGGVPVQFDVSHLGVGVYLVRVDFEGSSRSVRILNLSD